MNFVAWAYNCMLVFSSYVLSNFSGTKVTDSRHFEIYVLVVIFLYLCIIIYSYNSALIYSFFALIYSFFGT